VDRETILSLCNSVRFNGICEDCGLVRVPVVQCYATQVTCSLITAFAHDMVENIIIMLCGLKADSDAEIAAGRG